MKGWKKGKMSYVGKNTIKVKEWDESLGRGGSKGSEEVRVSVGEAEKIGLSIREENIRGNQRKGTCKRRKRGKGKGISNPSVYIPR